MPGSSHVTKTEYEILSEFRYTLRRFLRFSENAAEEVGITPQQHQALLDIMGFPNREKITIGELAERLQIHHHSAVGLVNRLCVENLIERTPAFNDRRQVYISLTGYGLSVLERLSKAHREELGLLAPQLRLLLERIIKISGTDKKGQKD
jgi:DNA-binding MarR family transcriptional regulator